MIFHDEGAPADKIYASNGIFLAKINLTFCSNNVR